MTEGSFCPDDDSNGPTEDEHQAICDCPDYVYARKQFHDLSQSHITTVSQFLNQPQFNRLAKCLMDEGMPSLMGLHQALNRH